MKLKLTWIRYKNPVALCNDGGFDISTSAVSSLAGLARQLPRLCQYYTGDAADHNGHELLYVPNNKSNMLRYVITTKPTTQYYN